MNKFNLLLLISFHLIGLFLFVSLGDHQILSQSVWCVQVPYDQLDQKKKNQLLLENLHQVSEVGGSRKFLYASA